MFSGIIQATGSISDIDERNGDIRVAIVADSLDLDDVKTGDSIAVNGVCLTVVEIEGGNRFSVDISTETLSCTTFSELTTQQPLNLERALRLSDRLDGHLVSGHVDGVGEVMTITDQGRSVRFEIGFPDQLARYIAKKGSICVDGVSLTVNDVVEGCFEVNIIPHTFQETLFSEYKVGTKVNLEVDLIARYLENLLNNRE